MERTKLGISENTDIFQASEFVELDISHASKQQRINGIYIINKELCIITE
ncbi:MAG: hypothetical protein K5829_01630 [Treponema sp.]|nr:hypothetical protein [Treponema sp.]